MLPRIPVPDALQNIFGGAITIGDARVQEGKKGVARSSRPRQKTTDARKQGVANRVEQIRKKKAGKGDREKPMMVV